MSINQTISKQHYIWLFLWWLCVYYAITRGSVWASVAFIMVFFITSTYKTLIRSIIIGIVCTIIAFIPGINLLFMVIGLLCILLRIKFLISNWRVLFVGVYAYGVHFILLMANSFRKVMESINDVADGVDMAGVTVAQNATATISDVVMFMGIAAATVMVLILHFMISWLYKHNYSTERAFLIMGLTPLIIVATIFPFLSHLKIGDIDLTGDSFLDADSISDAADSLSGVETGFMGAAAHGTNTLANKQENENNGRNDRYNGEREPHR